MNAPIENLLRSMSLDIEKKGVKLTTQYHEFLNSAIIYLTHRRDVQYGAEIGQTLNALGLGHYNRKG